MAESELALAMSAKLSRESRGPFKNSTRRVSIMKPKKVKDPGHSPQRQNIRLRP